MVTGSTYVSASKCAGRDSLRAATKERNARAEGQHGTEDLGRSAASEQEVEGAPGGIRTTNLLIRSGRRVVQRCLLRSTDQPDHTPPVY